MCVCVRVCDRALDAVDSSLRTHQHVGIEQREADCTLHCHFRRWVAVPCTVTLSDTAVLHKHSCSSDTVILEISGVVN